MTSDGRPGEEAAVGAMADRTLSKQMGDVVATASKAGDKMLALSWANFSSFRDLKLCGQILLPQNFQMNNVFHRSRGIVSV